MADQSGTSRQLGLELQCLSSGSKYGDHERLHDERATAEVEQKSAGRLLARPAVRGKQGAWNIHASGDRRSFWLDTYHDPFHRVLALPMGTVCLLFAAVYLVCWFGFAPVYMTISDDCDLDAGSYRAAVYYSMITMTTIGFGTPDMTFNGCWAACWAIMAQTLLGVLANAAMVGTFYSKLSRGKQRAGRVRFSSHACLRKVRGAWHFMFQVVDDFCTAGNSQLIEAHVRCIAIRHVRHDEGKRGDVAGKSGAEAPVFFQQCAMRLSRPDDQNGATLFLALPTLVTHRIDAWSPLAPPPQSPLSSSTRGASVSDASESDEDATGVAGGGAGAAADVHGRAARRAARRLRARDPRSSFEFPEVASREDDAECGSRSSCVCLVCGESYDTPGQLALHRASCAIDEVFSGHHVATVCRETGEVLPSLTSLRTYCDENDYEAPDAPSKKKRTGKVYKSLNDFDPKDPAQKRHSSMNHLGYLPLVDDEDGTSNSGGLRADGRGVLRFDAFGPGGSRSDGCRVQSLDALYTSTDSDDSNQQGEASSRSQSRDRGLAEEEIGPNGDAKRKLDDGKKTSRVTARRSQSLSFAEARRNRSQLLFKQKTKNFPHRQVQVNEAEVASMKEYFRESELEVLVLLEAIESETGSTIQSRFSYSFAFDEMKFNHTFVPCVRRSARNGERGGDHGASAGVDARAFAPLSALFDWLCSSVDFDRLDHAHRNATRAVIDMERFHQTRPVAADARHFRDAQAHA